MMETYLLPEQSASYASNKFNLLKTSTPKHSKRVAKRLHKIQNQLHSINNITEVITQINLKDQIHYLDNKSKYVNKDDLKNYVPESFNESHNDPTNKNHQKADNDNRDWRSISPSSSFNSSLNGSINMTPDRLRQKYDSEFKDAISSDLNILMDKQILDTCELTKEEIFCSEDLDEFESRYYELVAWLKKTLNIFSSKPICLSERHANQVCGEEMLQKLQSRESFEYHASRMAKIYPASVEDIENKRREIDHLWIRLQEIVNPSPQAITHLIIYRDVEADMKSLSNLITKMQEQIGHISSEFKAKNSSQSLMDKISTMILELDRQFKCLTSMTNVCSRMMSMENIVREKFISLHDRIPGMQRLCQASYLQLLEWQLQLDSDQFVPRNIDLEEIAEESEETYESLYDIPANGKMKSLDRRISTSAPSLHHSPSVSLEITVGNLTELEDKSADEKNQCGGSLRRVDVVKDLSNFLKFNSMPFTKNIVGFNPLNFDIDLRRFVEVSTSAGPYQDIGYSTGSKSPLSTANCSDSSGIVANHYDNIANNLHNLEDLLLRSKNIEAQQSNQSHLSMGHANISGLDILKEKNLCDGKFNGSYSKANTSVLDDLRLNSLVRKKKKVPTATLR